MERIARVCGALVVALCFVLVFSGLTWGAPDYLLAEGPVTGALKQERTSYDGFSIDPDPIPRFGELLGKGGFVGHYLARKYPRFDSFFTESELSLRPRSYYRFVNRPDGLKQEAFAIGGALEYRSGWLSDTLQVGLTGYTSQELYGPSDRGGSGLLGPGQDGITVLGEAWVKLKWREATLEVGRSSMDMPYLNRNDSRMIPQTFELLAVYLEPSDGWTFGLGHFDRIKRRNSSNFISMAEAAGADRGRDRGVTTAGLLWENGDSLDFALFNHYGWDTYNTVYSELQWYGADYFPFDWRVGLQFTDQRSVGDELVGSFDSQHIGFKMAGSYEGVQVTFAVTKTTSGSDLGVRNSWGGSPSYVSSMIADFDRPGELAGRLSVQASLEGLTKGLSTAISVGGGRTDHGSDRRDQEEIDFTVDYKPPALDGLWVRVRGAWRDREGDLTEDYRLIINYEKSF